MVTRRVFSARFRDEFLGLEIFDSLPTARQLTNRWQEDYNHRRPHSSLGYRTPRQFAAGLSTSTPVVEDLRSGGKPGYRASKQSDETTSLTQTVITAGTEN